MEYPGWNGWNEQENPASWYTSPWSGPPYDPGSQYYPPPEQPYYEQPYYGPPQEQSYYYPPPEQQYYPPAEQPYYYPPAEQPYYSPPPVQYWPPPEPEPLPQLGDLLEDADEEEDAEEEAPGRRSTLRKVLSIAINVLFFAVCLTVITGAVAFTFSNKPDKAFFGFRIYNVVSESMTPTVQLDGSLLKGGFKKGDAIIVKVALPEKVKSGDILTLWTNPDPQPDDVPLTHRCVEVLPSDQDGELVYFRTKGDHNADEDPAPFPGSWLIGIKVLTLPKMGTVLDFAQENKVLTIALSVTTLAVIFLLFVLLSRRPNDKTEEEQPPQEEPEPEPMPEPWPESPPVWPAPAPAYAYETPPAWPGYPAYADAYGAAYENQQWLQPEYQQAYQAYDPSWQWYQGL